jgi:hypothetical protein
MWKSLGHFFNTVGHLFIGVERSAAAAQPVIDAIAGALGSRAVGFLTVEHLAVSILADVIDLVKGAEKGAIAPATVTLTTEIMNEIRRLIQIVQAHPEAPQG